MRWRPNKAQIKDFVQKMNEIDSYCYENNIHQSLKSDSYYFYVNDKYYRVSNHTQTSPEYFQTRADFERTTFITAGKTRIIEIHKNLLAGKKLNARGFVCES